MYIHLQSGQHFPASYVSLPECKLVFGPKKIPPQGIMGKSREISWTFFEPCPPRPRWLFFFFYKVGPLQIPATHFKGRFFWVKFPGFTGLWEGVVGCKCKAHPLILCQGALRVLCCVHQADFFGDVEYGQFVIFASIVLENIYDHFSPSSTDQPPEKNLMKNPSLLFQNWKKTPSFSAENGSSKRPGPKAWRFPGFFCFRPHFPEFGQPWGLPRWRSSCPSLAD